MKHEATVEYDALAWVKPELDALLDRARQSLEAYVEDQAREDLINAAAQVLRQVRGTLQVVDLAGAVLLAEEIEALIDALLANEVRDRDAALGVLSTAVLQLPDYLEYVQGGHLDTPIIILPLLNDLRAARDAELLSENVVFVPDLDVDDALPQTLDDNADSIEAVARSKRHLYQRSLLSVFRDTQETRTLQRMIDIFTALEAASQQAALRRLWVVGAALVETLGGEPVPVSIKLLLGRLDREMRLITERGETESARQLPSELVKNLLYYVGRADSTGPRVTAVRESFHLDELLPQEGGLEEARRELSAPNVKLLETVSTAIREDLAEIRDQLEIYTHSDDTQAADFSAVAARLYKVADTLSMLGLGDAREVIAKQAERVDAVAKSGAAADSDLLMGLASAMLEAESELQHLLQRRRGADVGEAAEVANEITAAAVREALRDLNRVKDALLTYFAHPEERADLDVAPRLLGGIGSALGLIGIDAPLTRLEAIGSHIARLLADKITLPQGSVDALAEAVTAVEMYLESYVEQRPQQPAFLQRADEALARIEPGPNEVADEASGDDGDQAAHQAAPEGDHDPQVTTESVESWELAGVEVGGAGAPVSAVEETSLLAADELPATAAAAMEPGDARGQLRPLREDADQEILDIFLEEAQEEIERISTLLPRWQADHADEEAMTSIRRSFHTLKGSGRLAGAELLGEFAWAFENMLNRVIDQTVELGNQHLALVGEGVPALRQLAAQLAGGPAPEADLVDLMQRADAAALPASGPEDQAPAAEWQAELVHGSSGSYDADTPDSEQAADLAVTELNLDLAGVEDAEPTTLGERPGDGSVGPDASAVEATDTGEARANVRGAHIEPTLLDIYLRETKQRLAVIDDYLGATHGSGIAVPFDESMVIALHTLNGSARTAGLDSLSRVFAPLETIASRLHRRGRPLPGDMLSLFQQALTTTEATLEALPDASVPLPNTADLAARIEAASARLEFTDSSSATLIGGGERPRVSETFPDAVSETEEADEIDRDMTPDQDTDTVVGDTDAWAASQSMDASAETIVDELALPEPEAEPEAEPESGVEEAVSELAAPGTESRSQSPPGSMEQDGTPDRPGALDAELVDIFLDEADELMTSADGAVQAWEGGRDAPYVALETLQRDLHTLKGGARMAGFSTIGDLTHGVETLITRFAEEGGHPQEQGFVRLHEALDRLGDMLQAARAGQPVYPQPDLIARLASEGETTAPDAVSRSVTALSPEPAEAPEPQVVRLPPTVQEPEAAVKPQPPRAVEAPARPGRAQSTPASGGEQVRVRADLLDNLVNYAGEVNIYHARLQQQISGFGFNLNELHQTVGRLRDQLRKLELETEAQILYRFQLEEGEAEDETPERTDFDPLELDRYSNIQQLSRALAESLNDLASIEDILAEEVRDAETLLLQQQRVSTDLQDGLMRSRMVQFGGLGPRLRRIVRQTASELGKRVDLRLIGEHSEVDRSVLDRLVAPLEHMLRNAVAHGIEAPEQRNAVGKEEVGCIDISVAREGSEIVVQVQDDGRGIDVDAVRAKGQRQGLIAPDARLDDRQALQLILESGFSTAGEVSQIAGRGVGMDIVVSEVKQLGGTLSIDSVPGRGTRFVVRLPFTLTITQALLAQSGEHLYALPLSGVEGVVRVSVDQLRAIYTEESPTFEYLDTRYEVHALGTLLGGNPSPLPEQGGSYYPLMLIRSGARHVALQVDTLVGSREVVVKAMGPQFTHLRGVAGATILGDGRVVLILDTAELARLAGTQQTPTVESESTPAAESGRPLIMVVDDSITIRKVTSRVLERNGFEVVTARDGMDAVAQLEERKPDLLLTDIEMPRMDGYELSSHVRNDNRFEDVPIIVITSRSGEKHRQRARELGVDLYLGKPYQESELLDAIRDLLYRRYTGA